MSCTFSRQTLALHVEGDLPAPVAAAAARHLERCPTCREFLEHLRARQSLLKTLRSDTVSAADCAGVRHTVMSRLSDTDQLGWRLRIERAILHAFLRPSYALATCAVLLIVSASVLAQMRHVPAAANGSGAAFEDARMLQPDDYREWVSIGASTGADRVYIDPKGYRAFMNTGVFADGTMMIWERVRDGREVVEHPHPGASVLLASVKDGARFEGGWGYFDFTGEHGRLRAQADAMPASSSCRTCHQKEADTDSVFTQFYAGLRLPRRHS